MYFVTCDQDGNDHVAEFSHYSKYGGHAVYAVVCHTASNGEHDPIGIVDWYTSEAVWSK